MPNPDHSQPTSANEPLERYLDGLMSAEEAAQFEQQVAGDEQLQREIELQQRIDKSLERAFVAPAPIDILALAEARSDDSAASATVELAKPVDSKPDSRRRTLLTVLAACLVWVVVGGMVYRQFFEDEGYRELALAEIYENCIDAGFQPKWVCEDDAEFADTFQRRQGRPLLLKPEARDVMVGLSYLEGITPDTTTMLARVDGEPVLVFVDRLDRDTQPEKPSWWSGLNLFRSELEEFVLYEVTPLDEPRVMASFYIPDPAELPLPVNQQDEAAP